MQYFLNYNMKKGWHLQMAPIITANWRASSGNAWTVPVGGGVGRSMKLGFQPIAFLFPMLSPEEKKALMEEHFRKLELEQQKNPEKNKF